MDTRAIAGLLLLGRLVTVVFISMVVFLQIRLVRQNIYPEFQWYRKSLLVLTTILLIGNLVPIVIDSLGVFGKGSFNLLLIYVYSNNITAMLAAFVTWFVYHIAGRQ